MRSFVAAGMAFAMLAAAPTVTSDANYTEQNIAYILELAGYSSMPDVMIEVDLDGDLVLMPAADAVRLAAQMQSRLDLRNLGENALRGLVAAQDLGLFAFDCTRLAPPHVHQPFFIPAHWQFWIYTGHADNEFRCGTTFTTEWSTKSIQFFDAYPGTLVVGSGSFISFWGMTFGSFNGVVVRAAP